MQKKNPAKLQKKELKEKMENRLLIAMSICMVSYIAMLFAYRGFLESSFILIMKPILYSVGGVFLAVAIAFAVVYFVNKVTPEHRAHYGNYAIVAAIIGVCAFFVSVFNIHGIKILATVVTVYLVDAIVYYSYYIEFQTKRKLLWILFGAQFLILCAGWFFLLNNLSGLTMTIWSILSPLYPISAEIAKNINIGIGVVLGILGIVYVLYGIFTKNRKSAEIKES